MKKEATRIKHLLLRAFADVGPKVIVKRLSKRKKNLYVNIKLDRIDDLEEAYEWAWETLEENLRVHELDAIERLQIRVND